MAQQCTCCINLNRDGALQVGQIPLCLCQEGPNALQDGVALDVVHRAPMDHHLHISLLLPRYTNTLLNSYLLSVATNVAIRLLMTPEFADC